MDRAKANSQQLLSADIAARIAHEDKVQAKAALLPTVNWENGFIYTQPNGTDTGVFVANDGPHVYTNMANVHGDVFAPGKRADYRMAIAAEAIARAKVEIAARGLIAVVVQNFYGMAVAQRHLQQRAAQPAGSRSSSWTSRRSRKPAARPRTPTWSRRSSRWTSAQRDVQEAQLAYDKARIGFAVFLFPDFRQDFAVADDLDSLTPLAAFPEIEALARNNNPDIRAAQSAVTQQTFGIKSARAGLLPTLSVDYFYGLNANQYALHNEFGQNNLGSSVVASLNVPVWNWGAARSKVKQAELRLQQAHVDLSFTQRQLLANLNSFYLEANVASSQMASLKHSLDLAEESLKLTLLRYQAGEVTVLEVVDAQTTLLRRAQRLRRRTGALPPGAGRPANSNGGLLAHESETSPAHSAAPSCLLLQEGGEGSRSARARPGDRRHAGHHPPHRRGRRRALPARPGLGDAEDRGAGAALPGAARRSRQAGTTAGRAGKPRSHGRRRRKPGAARPGARPTCAPPPPRRFPNPSSRRRPTSIPPSRPRRPPRSCSTIARNSSSRARSRASWWTMRRWPTRRPTARCSPRRSICARCNPSARKSRSRPRPRRWRPRAATCNLPQAQVSYSQIVSPISGVVADRPLYAGEMATPGTPLVTVMDISKVVARVNVPQNQAASVKVGQPATITQVDTNQTVEGKVTVVSPATDPNSTTVQVWVQAENPGEQLKPGTSVHVAIMTEIIKARHGGADRGDPARRRGRHRVPGDRRRITSRTAARVKLGVREGDKVQILNGVRPGEEVVIVGGIGRGRQGQGQGDRHHA